jgi:hypothetical protein
MPKRSGSKGKVLRSRRDRDANEMARAVIERIEQIAEEHLGKNPAAVELGRKGGLKGGRARMDSMTAEERRKLAAKAAKARWSAKR